MERETVFGAVHLCHDILRMAATTITAATGTATKADSAVDLEVVVTMSSVLSTVNN